MTEHGPAFERGNLNLGLLLFGLFVALLVIAVLIAVLFVYVF
jgi:hypothetical protein